MIIQYDGRDNLSQHFPEGAYEVLRMENDITIKPITAHEDFYACEDVQRAAWAMPRDNEIVPSHLLYTVAHNGGIVLGAYTPDGQVVGFVFGIVGRASEERTALTGMPYLHCSHMMGVRPAYQGTSVGYRLKLAQREHAMLQGYRLAIWTYDPLLGPNARLNIEKLGAICRHYKRNVYGDLEGIYAGLPTDRFEVEWWLGSQRVREHIAGRVERPDLAGWLNAGAQVVNPTVLRGGFRMPGERADIPDAHLILLETPGDFGVIKDTDMDLAREWRMRFREACEEAFDAGYVVARFVSEMTEQGRRNYYVLRRDKDFLKTLAGGHDED